MLHPISLDAQNCNNINNRQCNNNVKKVESEKRSLVHVQTWNENTAKCSGYVNFQTKYVNIKFKPRYNFF